MANQGCATCKYRKAGTIHVVGYGLLPEHRCTKGKTGGKSVPATHAKVDATAKNAAKRGKGLHCDNYTTVTKK